MKLGSIVREGQLAVLQLLTRRELPARILVAKRTPFTWRLHK
ncbi:hypothetical protein NB231_10448 [Nitrococcus mobilis Nb-231]|uniref:Uncharacterized protein n=1 Tax=Nitrococcus mobilis Nb-231 TaxID=314278 RepID=A4BNR7_9GAMM|nr:hypothetical protein NB231_10448 [Nitrococcus mobilis Nb-231]